MSDDVLITPASRKIEFKDSAGNIDGVIQLDSSGNLVLTSTVGLLIGDLDADIHIGDGSSVVDMVFDWSGSIYSVANKDLTIGKSSLGGNDIIVDSPNWSVTSAGNATFAGDVTIAENKKIYFDSTDTYIYADTDSSEDLHIGADGHIELEADNDTIIKQGSTELARFTSTGLGIGTSSPEYKLDVTGSLRILPTISSHAGTAIRIGPQDNDIDVTLLRVDGNGGGAGTGNSGESDDSNYGFSLKYMGSGTGVNNRYALWMDNSAGTALEAMTVLQDGKVGIGTAQPSALLHLDGGGSEAMPLRLERSTAGGANFGVGLEFVMGESGDANAERVYGELSVAMDGASGNATGGSAHDGYMAFRPSLNGTPTERMRITSVGDVGIGAAAGGGYKLVVEETTNPQLRLQNPTNAANGWDFRVGDTGSLIFKDDGTERVRFASDGNVGIGTSSPGHKLHVSGPPDDSGDYAIYADEGSDNYAALVNRHSGNRRTALFYRNIHADYTAQPMVEMHNDHASDDQTVLEITQDGSGHALTATGGNVGIGTTSPASLLHVYYDATNYFRVGPVSGDANSFAGFGSLVQNKNMSVPFWNLEVNHSTSLSGRNNEVFRLHSNEGGSSSKLVRMTVGNTRASPTTEAFAIDYQGKVGIGTTNPASTLHLTSGSGYLKFDTSGSVGSIKSDFNLDLYADDTAGNSSGYQNIRFFPAGAEKMRIAHDGKVGIGTTSPEQKLHVIGDILSASGTGTNAAKDGRFIFSSYAGTNEWTGMYGYSGNGYNSLYLGGGTGSHEPASTIRFHTGADGSNAAGTERMRILEDGKVGIGEDAPGSMLEIRGATTIGTTTGHIMLTGDSATNGQGPQIVFSESGSGSSYAGAYIGHARTGSNSMGDLIFGTRATGGDANTVPTERMRILADGKVGILDSSPSYALDVAGDIRAQDDMYTDKLIASEGIRSGSRASFNTMTYYYYDRQHVGTNQYFLRAPVGGSSTENPASYFMPHAGQVMQILLGFYGQALATSGTDTWEVYAREPDDTLHSCDFDVNFANLVRIGTQNNYSILCDVSVLDDAISFPVGSTLSIKRIDGSPIDVENVTAQIWVTFDI